MSEELDVLKTVIQRLDKLKIPYMITGSIATNFYTIPRMTRDIDIVIELHLNDVNKLFNAFKDSFYIDKNMIKDAIEKQFSFNIIHNEKIVKVDFLIKKNSEYRKLEFSRRKVVELAGMKLSITASEDLIISKLFWAKDSHSEMQLKDVANIVQDSEGLDKKYLTKWIRKLNLEQMYNEVTK